MSKVNQRLILPNIYFFCLFFFFRRFSIPRSVNQLGPFPKDAKKNNSIEQSIVAQNKNRTALFLCVAGALKLQWLSGDMYERMRKRCGIAAIVKESLDFTDKSSEPIEADISIRWAGVFARVGIMLYTAVFSF